MKLLLFIKILWVLVSTIIMVTIFLLWFPIEAFVLFLRLEVRDYFKIKKITRYEYSH